jgi:hypothetical protein
VKHKYSLWDWNEMRKKDERKSRVNSFHCFHGNFEWVFLWKWNFHSHPSKLNSKTNLSKKKLKYSLIWFENENWIFQFTNEIVSKFKWKPQKFLDDVFFSNQHYKWNKKKLFENVYPFQIKCRSFWYSPNPYNVISIWNMYVVGWQKKPSQKLILLEKIFQLRHWVAKKAESNPL